MFEPKFGVNKDIYNEVNIIKTQADLDEFKEVLISVNPFYDWLEENINKVSYKLLKGFITNIVPLGDAGKKYFKIIAHKKTGFTIELWKIYNQIEKMYQEGNLKIKSYIELEHLGYTGMFLDERYPIDDVLKYLNQQ